MAFPDWVVLLCSVLSLCAFFASADTNPRDAAAANSLYISFNSPPLGGWVAFGGDPCGEQWEGVSCVFSNVTALKLNGMNLGGTLDNAIQLFDSIIEIDLSSNHIGGSIPTNLPPTLRNLSLANNVLNGSIPGTLSSLTQLQDLSLNNNRLTGGIPDTLQQLTSLVHLDLSYNNLSDILPPISSLSALSSLNLEHNSLIGTLDVLQDLPLQNLNVESNLFSGPIPEKLLNIPDFRRDGNPFNTTIIPSPPAPVLSSFPPAIPSPSPSFSAEPPWIQDLGPSSSPKKRSQSKVSSSSHGKIILITACGIAASVLLGLCVALPFYCKRRRSLHDPERHELDGYDGKKNKLPDKNPVSNSSNASSLLQTPPGKKVVRADKELYKNSTDSNSNSSSGGVVFTVATLQQYTNSFSDENLVGEGTLGPVYKAELPDGKLLAVKKLNKRIDNEQFLDLVSTISRIKHPNIVELVGHCIEHGHRLFVYEYCESGTLHDALHMDEEVHTRLSWNKRVRLALGSARALQHLHEVCQPPIVHRDFKSANVLLDYQLVAKVSGCGLGSLKSTATSSQGCDAPELELGGSYSQKSDVYSFGVVMLELLTGRKSYDSSRARGEQYLVRWAISKLHDIDSLSRMVDPSLGDSYTAKSLSRFADIISRCIQSTPEFRPAMSEVVQDLLQMI